MPVQLLLDETDLVKCDRELCSHLITYTRMMAKKGTQNCADQQQEIESGAVLALSLKEVVLAAILGLSRYQWNLVIEFNYHNTPYAAPTCHVINKEESHIYKRNVLQITDLVKKHVHASQQNERLRH